MIREDVADQVIAHESTDADASVRYYFIGERAVSGERYHRSD